MPVELAPQWGSDQLGVTREAAKSRLRRARTLVREYLLGIKNSGREST